MMYYGFAILLHILETNGVHFSLTTFELGHLFLVIFFFGNFYQDSYISYQPIGIYKYNR